MAGQSTRQQPCIIVHIASALGGGGTATPFKQHLQLLHASLSAVRRTPYTVRRRPQTLGQTPFVMLGMLHIPYSKFEKPHGPHDLVLA
jgi:hypothetical protein